MRIVRAGCWAMAVVGVCVLAGCGQRGVRDDVASGSHDLGIRIGPDRPDVTSQLEVAVDVKGVDPARCGYVWSRNGEPIAGQTTSMLPPSVFRKDDLVAVVATLPPAADGGPRQLRAEVRIGNAPPRVASARVAISATTAGNVLQAELDSSDPDGDPLTNSYRWFENGREVDGANASSIQLASASRGGRWAVEVVVNDGANASEPRRSSEFVLDNRPPAFTSQPPAVLPADGVYRYQATASDPDGDPVRFELAEGPAGMSVSSSGAIEWRFPTDPLRAKSFHIVLRVTDAKGGEAKQTIDLAL